MTLKEAVAAAGKLGLKITGIPSIRKTLPKTKMGVLVDEYRDIKELRLAADKVAEALKSEEQRILDHVIENVPVSESGVVGKRFKGIIVTERKPVVEDWDKFYEHVRKTKSFDLLQKRLSDTAVKDRLEDGKAVPGVGSFIVKKLSVTKVK